jgi:hypothetical protein
MSENIERTLGRMEAKVDIVLERTAKMEPRIASLEKWQARVIGAYALLVVIIGIAIKFAR